MIIKKAMSDNLAADMHKVEHDTNRMMKIEGKLDNDNQTHDRFELVTTDGKVSELI